MAADRGAATARGRLEGVVLLVGLALSAGMAVLGYRTDEVGLFGIGVLGLVLLGMWVTWGRPSGSASSDAGGAYGSDWGGGDCGDGGGGGE